MNRHLLLIFFSMFCMSTAFGQNDLIVACHDGNGDGLWSIVLENSDGQEHSVLTYSVGNRRRCNRIARNIIPSSDGFYPGCRDGNNDGLWSLVLLNSSGSEGQILQRDIGRKRSCVKRLAHLRGPVNDSYLVCRDGNGDGLWSTVLVDTRNNEKLILNRSVGTRSVCEDIVLAYPWLSENYLVACRDGNGDGLWSIVNLDFNNNEKTVLEYRIGNLNQCIDTILSDY